MLGTTKKRADLELCPFCSGEAMVRRSVPKLVLCHTEKYSVFCTVCHCETDLYETEEQAVGRWNTRVKQLNLQNQ